MYFCSRRVYNIENTVDIKDFFFKSSSASLSTSNLEYDDIIIGFCFNPTNLRDLRDYIDCLAFC